MSNNSSKILDPSIFTRKVNYIGRKLLRNSYNNIKNNKFSVVLISDTHSEQLNEKIKKYSSLEQYCSLLKKIKLYEDVCCIIHGGDAIQGYSNNTKKTNAQLKQFINSSKLELYDKIEQSKMISFIMNAGNHDYCYENKNNNSNNFNELVGDNSDLIQIKRHLLDIILLDTGYTHNGFPNVASFKKQIYSVEKKIKKEHKKVQFLIDMHIPPQLGDFKKYSNHTLSVEPTNEFVRFLNKYQNRIIAVSCHHIHNFHCEDSSIPVYIHPEGNIPIYLTSSGGHKDSNKHFKSEYKCLKMNFEINGDSLRLKSVEEIKL